MTPVLSRTDLGQRIAAARDRAALSQAQLAAEIGLTQSAVSRIESGDRGVDSLELAAIAERLGVPVVELLETRPLASKLRLAARQEAVSGTTLDRAIDRVAEVMWLDELLREIDGDAEQKAPPTLAVDDRALAVDQGRQLAKQARELWGLDDDPLPDLFGLIEDRAGLGIVLEPLEDGLDGLCARADDSAIAVVDSSAIYGRQRFTAAHELCHFLLGDGGVLIVDENLFGQGFPEMRANAFAAYFLMPETGIERWIRERAIDGRVVTELQYTFGVSLDALLWHFLNLGKIDAGQRRELGRIGAKSLAYRFGYGPEWERIEGQRGARRAPGGLLRRALNAFADGKIGLEPVADLLGRRDLDALRRELEDHGIVHDARWWEADAPA